MDVLNVLSKNESGTQYMLNSLQILLIVKTSQIFFSHFNKIRGVLDIWLYII